MNNETTDGDLKDQLAHRRQHFEVVFVKPRNALERGSFNDYSLHVSTSSNATQVIGLTEEEAYKVLGALQAELSPHGLCWCVQHKDGWCAAKGQRRVPRESGGRIRTLCGHYIILPLGVDWCAPTCKECLARMKRR